MSGRKNLVLVGETFQAFQFRRYHYVPLAVAADVQGDHPDRVARDEVFVFFLVVQGESVDPVEVFQKVDPLFPVERQDDLAVRSGLELVVPPQTFAQLAVVVYLAVDAQGLRSVGAYQGLSARSGVDDRKTFVRQDGRTAAIDAAPVRAPVSDAFTHL